MIIFIDTNIFFNHWYFENANFKYLFNYLENTNSKLAIPEIVCEEVDGKFKSEFSKLKNQYEDNVRRLKTFSSSQDLISTELLNTDYSFKTEIKKATYNTVFIKYDDIPNSEVVKRAINRVRPFKDDDKGFRDTLIWLSFINYLAKEKVRERIAFINNNPIDFYDKNKTGLHPDLLADVHKLGVKNEFNIYHSIKEFIDKEVDKRHNKYSQDQIFEDFINPTEHEIQYKIESIINSLSAEESQLLLKESQGELNDIPNITGFDFVIVEGIEDAELLNWALINDKDLYIEMYLNLRIVEFSFSIPLFVYSSRKNYFDEHFYDIEKDGDIVNLTTYKRPHLNISFNFNVDNMLVNDIAINSFETE